MTTHQHLHTVRLCPPFFNTEQSKEEGKSANILRYLDSDFIARFQLDVQKKRFVQPQFSAWIQEEQHSQFDKKPVLRLPTHRVFHLICCEVICERFGMPALDPAHISSAGFVIRKVANNDEKGWMMEEGEPIGWQETSKEKRDPDLDRRICAGGNVHPRPNQLTYSGEQTHPLHVLTTRDEKDKQHTLLYGYVPLGGSYFERETESIFDKTSQQETETFAANSLPYPFGYREETKQQWSKGHELQINNGVPTKAFYELLQLLVNRYHLGEEGRDTNSALEELFSHIWFYDSRLLSTDSHHGAISLRESKQYTSSRKFHLLQYLTMCFAKGEENRLVQWLIEHDDAAFKAGGLDELSELSPLPDPSGEGTIGYSLTLLQSDAENIRHQLGQRYRTQTLAQAKEIPLPKFSQGEHDVYQLVPFVRYKNHDGKEQLQWGDQARSQEFRVAAPFDPEASRPSFIPMPSLRDLKRGLAKGASLLTPGDTFDLIQSLNVKKGVSEDIVGDSESSKPGIQWICSFSLPVITLVAMILLMIMISLLNIVFFWLPWVRICLPFPKINKE